MGTNFYIGEKHIGKRSSVGGGKMLFIWAVHPSKFYDGTMCCTFIDPEYMNKDDEMQSYEWSAARDAIRECEEFDYSRIGREFS